MRNSYIKKLLASLFLVATFLGAFHHHNDTGVHQDCPIHILEASIVSGDIPLLSLIEKIDIRYQAPLEAVAIHTDTSVHFGYFGRAPPYFL
jgi:hypothetical protein